MIEDPITKGIVNKKTGHAGPLTERSGEEEVMSVFTKPAREWFVSAFGRPTKVQLKAWPAIAAGSHTLVSAPTGTGKTLSAFLYFIDHLKEKARNSSLKPELYLIYISPLKSLAGDIRENLRRPLDGIRREAEEEEIRVAIRTGDTLQRDRRRMIKHPPHILITTPESLYLMLSSRSGRNILMSARAIILDELHALMDTKRGAHLMLSIARLDRLCGRNVQRIGLSATIEPLSLAAEYLAPDQVVIAAPAMIKQVEIVVAGSLDEVGKRRKDPIWEQLAQAVYQQCMGTRSVIAFSEARRYAEKLAYYVNQLGGEGFARVHHGSLSKEQRMEVENDLRDGWLRLLCATSSMELGIDVGDIDLVLQIGCPRSISSTMQRLGRAGHNPNRVSVMYMYPRTAPEGIYCGMSAELARKGGVESLKPPRLCFDVLAQHLVSMASDDEYTIDEVMDILKRTYSFREVTRQDVKDILAMLAGDYEHSREIPVRARLLYDRIHEKVSGDTYSRMLAVAAGGTIPDKGLFMAKTEDGVKVGELDEEFVFETRIGDTFLLGSFAWRILRQDKDTVVVTQAPVEGAKLPFWKGETKGRPLKTSISFGRIMRKLAVARENGTLMEELRALGLDEAAAESAQDFLLRQISITGCLPDDRTILMEHFRDASGSHQIMVHSMFGRQVNSPLAILMQRAARKRSGLNVGCVDEEDGFLLYPYDEQELPEGLFFEIDPGRARGILEAILPVTPLFSFTFRYNAARALMMGMKQNGRQPLWLQRLRSTQMMDALIGEAAHPLIRETKRECLEDQWDIQGTLTILNKVHAGEIAVREIYVDSPSPMSLPLQWRAEAEEMYTYTPSTSGLQKAVDEELNELEKMKPSPEELQRLMGHKKQPEDENRLHSLLMIEGDLLAGEVEVAIEWLEGLAGKGLASYIEPGLWIAAEHREEYDKALLEADEEAASHIIRRLLYYRGAQSAEQIEERYFMPDGFVEKVVDGLVSSGSIVADEGVYYHSRLYARARKATIKNLRMQAATQPGEHYAGLMAQRSGINAPAEEALKQTLGRYQQKRYPVSYWEEIILPARVKGYREAFLDKLLSQGDYFWKWNPDRTLHFNRYDDIDWDREEGEVPDSLTEEERVIYQELKRRGASFLKSLTNALPSGDVQAVLLNLAEKGLVCADSFVPVRQIANREKIKKSTARQRVNARVMLVSAGRFDLVRPVRRKELEEIMERMLADNMVLCRETFRYLAEFYGEDMPPGITWGRVLEMLGIWEYTGKIRRGYFFRGMSGAQFVRNMDYQAVLSAQNTDIPEESEIIWLNAADPAQVWGKVLEHKEGRSFLCVPGTAAALKSGIPAAVFERKGKVLRCFEDSGMEEIMSAFVRSYKKLQIFPDKKRLVIKEYPEHMGEVLKQAGFMKEMQDYVLYR